MNDCCIRALAEEGIRTGFVIADEGARFTCPTCKLVIVKHNGKFKVIDRLVCVRQADTWRWSDHLGAKTPGECSLCGAPIFFEAQNADIEPKVCAQCAGLAV